MKYIFYLISGCLFALTAAMFVRVFAPYACGSGIPEVRCWFLLSNITYLFPCGKLGFIFKKLFLKSLFVQIFLWPLGLYQETIVS